MPRIRPFAAVRPAPGRAADVVAPPYDAVSSEQARVRAAGRPWSFLHVSKPEIDLPAGIDPHEPAVYAKAKENFTRMLDAGVLVRDPTPAYYVYRIAVGEHSQTGIVATASIAAYEANVIRKHEHTRPDKEDDRVRHMAALNAQTGPALLVYPGVPELERLLAEGSRGTAESDTVADDGVRHTTWAIREARVLDRISAIFDEMPALYIADGHHRTAAASRIAVERRRSNPPPSGEESYERFLMVAFPDHQPRILAYHRVVRDLRGMAIDAFLAKVRERFTVTPSDAAVQPNRPGEFGLYAGGRWYRLTIRADLAADIDPIDRLDVSLLTHHILAPILGIGDPRTDYRIDFVGGGHGLAELERRVDTGEMAAALSLFPTKLADMMTVADAGGVMPPKSTWFDPKLADGLFAHILD